MIAFGQAIPYKETQLGAVEIHGYPKRCAPRVHGAQLCYAARRLEAKTWEAIGVSKPRGERGRRPRVRTSRPQHAGYPYRRCWYAYALALVVACLIGFGLREALVRFPRGLLTDDAYFYAQIAYNLADQGISSFDGVHVTDGYHLLWTWLLSGLSWVVGLFTTARDIHLSAMVSLYLFVGAVIGCRFGRSLPMVLLFSLLAVVPKMLMETTLLALLVLMLAEELFEQGPAQARAAEARPSPARSSQRRHAWAGRVRMLLLTILIPVTRIDAVLFPLILAAGLWIRGPMGWRNRFTTATSTATTVATVVAGVVAGCSAQLLANRAIAGHWLSVSATLKAGVFGDPGAVAANLQANLSGHYWGGLVAFVSFVAVLLLAVAVVNGWAFRARVGREITRSANASETRETTPETSQEMTRETARQNAGWDRFSLKTLIIAAVAYVGFHLLANNTMRYWYYVPSLCLLIFALQEAAPARSWAGRLLRVGWIVLAAGLMAKYAADSHLRGDEIAHARSFVCELREAVPEDELIFQIDGTGYVGFMSGRRVVNGDGLVHTHAYARRLLANRLAGYPREEDIGYLVTSEYPRGDTLIAHHGLIVTRDQVETLIAPPGALARLTAFGLHRFRDRDAAPPPAHRATERMAPDATGRADRARP